MLHLIFNYYYGHSCYLLIIFIPLGTEMNTLPSRHKQFHFNLITSPLYLVKLKMAQNGRPLTAVLSVEPIVTTTNCYKLSQKVVHVPFVFSLFVRKFF